MRAKPKKMNFKYATRINLIRSQLLKVYPDTIETFEFITKTNRENLNLPRDPFIDTCAISSGGKELTHQFNKLTERRQ